jgi:hypothetical protein
VDEEEEKGLGDFELRALLLLQRHGTNAEEEEASWVDFPSPLLFSLLLLLLHNILLGRAINLYEQ